MSPTTPSYFDSSALLSNCINSLRRGRSLRGGLMLLAISIMDIPSAIAAKVDIAAQQYLLQQERERALKQQYEQTADVRLMRPTAPQVDEQLLTHESPCFNIQQVTLKGEAATQFEFALNDALVGKNAAVGHCLGAKGIGQVLKRIQNTIHKKGYVTTQVVVAEQDLNNGVLRFVVIPGRVRNVRFAEGSKGWGITKWDAVPIRSGDILNLHDIEQGLENLKRSPTTQADIQIKPAQSAKTEATESDLVISYKQAFPLRLSLNLDDTGSRDTGRYQAGGTLSYDNPLKLNDLFYFSYNHDVDQRSSGQHGTSGYVFYYAVPFGYWQLSASHSKYHYDQLISGNYQPYHYSGDTENTELTLSHVIYRDAKRKTTASLASYLQESRNYIEDTEVEIQHRRVAGLKPGIFHREFIGDSTLDVGITYRNGVRAMGALPAPEEKLGEGSSLPHILNGDINYNLPFSLGKQKLRYHFTWRGQWTDDVLIPQDRFSIAGRFTIRGFDGQTTLAGERGWLVRNDLGLALGTSGQELYLGFDYGRVDGHSAEYLVGKGLGGGVIGLHGGLHDFSYDVFVGRPITKPNRFNTADAVAGFSISWSC